jgi:hypothetical protein
LAVSEGSLAESVNHLFHSKAELDQPQHDLDQPHSEHFQELRGLLPKRQSEQRQLVRYCEKAEATPIKILQHLRSILVWIMQAAGMGTLGLTPKGLPLVVVQWQTLRLPQPAGLLLDWDKPVGLPQMHLNS